MKTILIALSFVGVICQAITPPEVSLTLDGIRHLYLYRPIGENKIEVIRIKQTQAYRYFVELKDHRERPDDEPTMVSITSVGANPNAPGDGTENNPKGLSNGSTLGEGRYYFPKSEAYVTDVIRREVKGSRIYFETDSGARPWRENWKGEINLETYGATLVHESDRVPVAETQTWRVSYFCAESETPNPLERRFYTVRPSGTSPQVYPEKAVIRPIFSLFTGRLWFPTRKVVRANRSQTARLRAAVQNWIREEHLEPYGIMVTSFDDETDTFGEIGVYLPVWLTDRFQARFGDQIAELKMTDRWGFEFYSSHPRWREATNKEVPRICINALLNPRADHMR